MSPAILLVEDEVNVSGPLADYLAKEGFRVARAGTLAEAETRLEEARPELVLLDWMLPDGQGIELLKRLRARGLEVPTILLTARAELVDKVLGLELGANDYVTKPFEPRELVARIRVQLRAAEPGARAPVGESPLERAGIRMEPRSREVRYEGKMLELTKTEYELLRVFLENPNQVFSREELLKQVWGYEQYPTTRTVDTHILQLRQKTKALLFETVHGIGYRFRCGRTPE
jgi:DNA-binding response OmpR family regulator